MKEQFKLNKQELKGFKTIMEVIVHVCKNKNLQCDSFFLIDENQQLLTASNTQIDVASINEVNVYNLRDNQQFYEKLQKDNQLQQLQDQKYEQAQKFYTQIVSYTKENSELKIQIQSNDKIYKSTNDDLISKIEASQKEIKSQKTKIDELQQKNQQLIKEKDIFGMELKEFQEQCKNKDTKYKNMESDYEEQKQKLIEDADQEIEQLNTQLRGEKNKNKSLNIEIQKMPKLLKTIEQKDQDFLKYKQMNEEEKQQLETQLTQVKIELQNMTTKSNELQNQLQIAKNQEQQLKNKSEKLNQDNQEKNKNLLKEQDQIQQQEMELNRLKQELSQKGVEINTLSQQLNSLNKNLEKTKTDLIEMQKNKNQIEIAKSEQEFYLGTKLKDEQNKNQQLTQEKEGLQKLTEHLKQQFTELENQLEELPIQIHSLKRQIKPVIYPKITGLIENLSLKFKQEYSKFITHADIQTQDYQFELFAIQVDNQAEFDRSLLKSLNLQQLSKFISIKSLEVQTIKKTIQPATDNTFFEGNLFQIANPTDKANNHDPNLKTKTFLIKTIKMLKNNGFLPKTAEEAKQLLIPNLASMSILNQFIAQLKNKDVKPPAFKFPQQYLMQAQTENDKYFYHIEELVDGELLKLSSSSIPLKDTPEAQFSNSLVYYSFKKLHEKAMLTNIQGIRSADETITIYDTVFCSEQGLSSDIDLGNEEIVKMRDLIEKNGKKFLGDFYEKVKDFKK